VRSQGGGDVRRDYVLFEAARCSSGVTDPGYSGETQTRRRVADDGNNRKNENNGRNGFGGVVRDRPQAGGYRGAVKK